MDQVHESAENFRKTFQPHKINPFPDATIRGLRWFPTCNSSTVIRSQNPVPDRQSVTAKKSFPVRNAPLTILSTIALVAMLRYAQDLFVPIVLAVLIAYAAAPLVTAIAALRIPRTLAAGLVVVLMVSVVGCAAYLLRHQATTVLQSLPEAATKVRRKIQEVRAAPIQPVSALGSIRKTANEIEQVAQAASSTAGSGGVAKVQIVEPAMGTTDVLWFGSLGIIGIAGQAVLVLFLVFFFLASGDLFKRKIVRILGSTLLEKRVTVETLNEINRQIAHFLTVQILTCFIVGTCTAAALGAFGVQQPIIWGIAAGIFNSVPYFGPIIVTSALALVAFLQFESLGMVVKIAAVVLAITSLEGLLLTPMLMGRAARINGVAMFISILFWSWVWGVIGMIVAVPIMMVIKSVCHRVEDLQPIAELLDER
jgi:predicted PurR-regulated permease PerM